MPTPAVQLTTRPPGSWSGGTSAAGAGPGTGRAIGDEPGTKGVPAEVEPAGKGVPAGEGPVREEAPASMKPESVPSSITVTSPRPKLMPYHQPFRPPLYEHYSESCRHFRAE